MKILPKIPKTYLFLGIIIFLIVLISWYELKNPGTNSSSVILPIENQKTDKQEKEEGEVSVTVEYIPKKSDKNTRAFEISLDTHSVELDSFDFVKDVILEKDGKAIPPANSIPSGGGHHRKAEVVFERVKSPFTISLINLSGVPKRVFQFTNIN